MILSVAVVPGAGVRAVCLRAKAVTPSDRQRAVETARPARDRVLILAVLRRGGEADSRRLPLALSAAELHLNLKSARWTLPSLSWTTSWRHVPAHDGSVFQT